MFIKFISLLAQVSNISNYFPSSLPQTKDAEKQQQTAEHATQACKQICVMRRPARIFFLDQTQQSTVFFRHIGDLLDGAFWLDLIMTEQKDIQQCGTCIIYYMQSEI